MVLLGVAFGIAVVATVLLALHVWRRFPTMPARIPLHIGFDGRPGPPYPRAFVWLVPAIFTVVVAAFGVNVLGSPPAPADRPVLALVLFQLALVAYLMAWVVDRLIELGRHQTYRIAPGRIALVVAAIVAPIVLILFVARLWSAGS
ncbi:MAG TPA: hypothetical protein VE591_01145 [Candidatus Acidoferrum sp.]|nr:hypothetical protein [Candidatus Acidoferrum sp.]